MDYAERITRGQPSWRDSYIAQGDQKRLQIDLMIRYAETNQCRMSTLVRHFGDVADGHFFQLRIISANTVESGYGGKVYKFNNRKDDAVFSKDRPLRTASLIWLHH